MTKSLFEKLKTLEEKAGPKWIHQLEGIETSKALQDKALQWGITLTDEEAEEGMVLLEKNENQELTDQELVEITGGKIQL